MTIELEQEEDDRWIAEVIDLPEVLAYGRTRGEAMLRVKALTLHVLADRIEQGEDIQECDHIAFLAA